MPNEFSVEIHNYLSRRIAEAQRMVTCGDHTSAAHARGQLRELLWIREYLQDNIDLKNYIYF